ncbi:MAG: hypothetical protein PUF13_00595 [Lachnospiraceae bacterium]|nr:hypothetical protein [Lachnospiraceae bacterium]
MKKNLITKLIPVMTAASMVVSGGITAAAEEGGPFDFKSVSEVTFPLEEKLELDVFVYATNTGGGTFQTNYVTDYIEEKTNIHLNFVYDLDGDDAKTKLNLIMTDPSSMPDIFLATNWTKSELQSYGQQGLVIPLDDYLADAPMWNQMNKECPSRLGDLTMSDGHVYNYGQTNECFHCQFQNRMYIYMPWVESLNDGHVPETTEELYEFLKKVKENDPNGNGIADEVPMTGYIGGWATDPTNWLVNAFVQNNNPLSNTNPTVAAGLVVNDGKIEYSPMKDEYKEAMAYIHKLYAEGLLDNQTFTQDNTQCVALLDNPDANLVAVHAGGGMQVDGEHFWANQEGPWQDWTVLSPVAGPEGIRLSVMGLNNYFASCQGVVSANCEYPEIAVALFDFLCNTEPTIVQSNGPEGLGWNYTDEGVGLDGEPPLYEKYYIPEDYDWVGNGYKQNYGKNYYWASDATIGQGTAHYRARLRVQNPDTDVEYHLQKWAEQYAEFAPDESTIVPNLVFEGQDAQVVSEGTLTIGGYVNQACVQFITGDLDVEKDWDTYISKLEAMGVENYIATYQKAYDAYMSNLQ